MASVVQSQREEQANAITHGIGLILAIVGCFFLALTQEGSLRKWTAVGFGVGLIFVYLTSTAFHLARKPRKKVRWRTFDHAAIYVLIAATYVAVTPIHPGGLAGWLLAGFVCLLAVFGAWQKLRMTERIDETGLLDLALYIAMGWSWLLLAWPIYQSLPTPAFVWLLVGGGCYTFGTIFFAIERIPFNHAIWHLFVLAGSACHFIMVARYR